jgi:UDP-N-acetylmuramoyl-tripeptide--D-alanyl-D-alanine ligase
MKKLIQFKLKILAKLILKKYKPKIIGISGSVGKTSSKDAVYIVLKDHYKTRRSLKNYNNEIGLPLTIIGEESGGRSILGWIAVFLHAFNLILFTDHNYPEILVLEMGIDRPGDMDYLNTIVEPDIAVLTLIDLVHVEYFESRNKLNKEKGKLIENIKKDGLAIINLDDDNQEEILKKTKTRVCTYGFNESAEVRAQDVQFSYGEDNNSHKTRGVSFRLFHKDKSANVFLPNILSSSMVYATLVATSVAVNMDISLADIVKSLKEFKVPEGRLNLIKGIKNTMIIDDTYNSEPQSAISALNVLKSFPIRDDARRFAILGDMLELGSYSEESHREVGHKVFELGIDKLITVGERSRDIDRGALDAGMLRDNVFNFKNSDEAKIFIQDRIMEGDLILVKGSQGIRTEKIVLEIMAEPLRAKELLVRQDESWV